MSSDSSLAGTGPDTTPTIEQPEPDDEASKAEPTTEESLQREQIFEILSNERRRLVLGYLQRYGDEDRIDFRDLVDQVAAWENGIPSEEVDSNDRKCVYTALRQTHLPKLDRLDVIEYDHNRGTIEPKSAIDEVFRYMKHVPERDRFWSRLYLLLAVLSGAASVLIWVEITPLAAIPGIGVAIGIAAVFGAFSLAQIYQSSQDRPRPEEQL